MPFVDAIDKEELREFLGIVENGCDYLDSLITNANCNDKPLVWAIQGYVYNVRPYFERFRKAEKARQREYAARQRRTQPSATNARATDAPLLVPARPSELPTS